MKNIDSRKIDSIINTFERLFVEVSADGIWHIKIIMMLISIQHTNKLNMLQNLFQYYHFHQLLIPVHRRGILMMIGLVQTVK